MVFNYDNPLGMGLDPFDGTAYVLPETFCTDERKLWFRRAHEVFGFLMITELALKDSRGKYEQIQTQKKLGEETPFRVQSTDGRTIIVPFGGFIKGFDNGVDVLCRQIFVMFYGSFENYLFELLERSFPQVGVTQDILKQSLKILMGGGWDGKFCKLHHVFGIGYRATDLVNHFKEFQMDFEGKIFNNPLLFLDELAQIRHEIVHASSICGGRTVFINAQLLYPCYGFYAHLTDYVDQLFAKRFGYHRVKTNPAQA